MLRAFFAHGAKGKLPLPFHRFHVRAQSGLASKVGYVGQAHESFKASAGFITMKLSHVKALMMSGQEHQAENIHKNYHSMAILEKMHMTGEVQLMMILLRQIVGNKLEKFGMKEAVESAEKSIDQVQRRLRGLSECFKEVACDA